MKKIETFSEDEQLLMREIAERKMLSVTLRERLTNNDLIIQNIKDKLEQYRLNKDIKKDTLQPMG